MRTILPLLAFVLAATACASDPLRLETDPAPRAASAQVDAAVGEAFQLRPGEVASLRGSGWLVAFRGVRSDSRCPEDVTCVWAGDAELGVGIAEEGGPWTWHLLHTTLEPGTLSVGDEVLSVVDVLPAPRTDRTVDPADYVARLRLDPR